MRPSQEEPTLGVVLKKGITAIALRGHAAVFVVALGCGVQTAAQGGLSIPAAAAMAAASGQAHADPQGPGGGALPVVPVHGGCIIGLNCGCIRGTTGPCSGPPLLKHPAIHNSPPDDRSAAGKGHN
jgi:hypothetical protein